MKIPRVSKKGAKVEKSENKDAKIVRGFMTRLEKLKEIFEKIDEDKRAVIEPLLDDVVFLEERLAELRKLPTIRYDKKNPARQEVTAAGKQYKEYMQSYLNAIKVLQKTLYLTGASEGSSWLDEIDKEFGDSDV